MVLNVRVGTVPILWNNDDVPELTPPVPCERVLAEMAEAGFQGTELGTNYPRDPLALRALLGRFGLMLSGGYFCDEYRESARHAEVIEKASRLADFLAACGARYLIVADCIHPERSAVAGRARGHCAMRRGEFSAFVDALDGIVRVARRAGLTAVFHNHAGTYVETPDELDALMRFTDDSLRLCLDTGHYLFAGGDPVEAIRRYGRRLEYVHLKDVDGRVHADAMRDGASFLDCLRRRVFCEVGQGRLDVRGVLRALKDVGYAGWIVCEQDTGFRPPLESARLSRRNLAAALKDVA